MAVNTSRSMTAELHAGLTDGRDMKLAPNWNTESTAAQDERLDWPGYGRVERHDIGPGWLVDSPESRPVAAAKARAAQDHYSNPTSGTRETQVDADIYRLGKR